MKTLKTIFLTMMVLFFCINQAYAGESNNEWQYEVTPYLLAAGMNGDIGIHHHTTDLDVSFSDIWDDLDAGFMGLFTAHKGRWLLGLEGVYMKLEGDTSKAVTGPLGVVSGKVNWTLSTACILLRRLLATVYWMIKQNSMRLVLFVITNWKWKWM